MSLPGYVIVFGAGGGIGSETAYTFAERGASGIIFADIDEESAQASEQAARKLATHSAYRSLTIKVDVRDRESVKRLVQRAVEEFGRIDFSIYSAGVGVEMEKTVMEMPDDEFDRCIAVNTRGTFIATAEVARVMVNQEEQFAEGRTGRRSIGRGRIINISSVNGILPISNHVQYGASKYGSIGVTETAAAELARKGVRVNGILPSWVEGPMMNRDFVRQTELPGIIKSLCPVGRSAYPEEIAEAIHFLCTPGASFINGHSLVIDAGTCLTRGLA